MNAVRECIYTTAVAIFLMGFSMVSSAQVVVIPMGSDGAPLKNVVTVAKNNGDFIDPIEAIDSISDANESNPYLLYIGPGVYTLTEPLDMREYVDIVGSGRNATKLTGATGGSSAGIESALIVGSENASLRGMTVENTGGDSYSIGVYNNASSPTIADLAILASGGTYNTGVYNMSSSPKMFDASIVASGGNITQGVFNLSSSSPTMTNLVIEASGAISDNYAIDIRQSSSPIINNVNAKASGGGNNYGINVWVSSSPSISNLTIESNGGTQKHYGIKGSSSSPLTISNTTITATGGTESYGVHISASAYAHISNSRIEGATNSVSEGGADADKETYIIGTILTGPISHDPKCSFVFYSDGTELDSGCLPPSLP